MKPISREFIERCERWIQLHRQEMIEDIQSFVRIRSVSNAQAARPGMPFGPECGRMLSFALDRARQLGFEVEDHEGYCGSVYLGNRESTLGYMAHLDTVPEGEGWIYPPFACVQVEDCLIGRGVQDNKGPAVVGLYLLRMFRDLMVPMRHGLELVLGVSEETGMQDLSYYAEHVRQPALSLVADGGFPLNYAQKGSLSACISLPADRSILDFEGGTVDNVVPAQASALLPVQLEEAREAFERAGLDLEEEYALAEAPEGVRIHCRGVAAHAAAPEGGRSAIHRLAQGLAASGLMGTDAQKTFEVIARVTGDTSGAVAGIACEDDETGKTTMVLGVAHLKEGRIGLHVDARLSLAADLEGVQRNFRAYLGAYGFRVDQLSVTRPFYIPKDDPKAECLSQLYQQITGCNLPPYTMGGGTYSRVVPDAITFGPGRPEAASDFPVEIPAGHGGGHQPDEIVYVEDLCEALLVYAVAMAALDDKVDGNQPG